MSIEDLIPATPNAGNSRRQRRQQARRRRTLLSGSVILLAAAATGAGIAWLTSPKVNDKTLTFPDRSATSTPPAAATTTATSRTSAAASSASSPATSSAAASATSFAQLGRTGYSGPAWPSLKYTLEALQGTQPPDFPSSVNGFARSSAASSTVSLKASKYFTAVGKLPVRSASYSECRKQRFYIRWMAVDPQASVEASFVDAGVRTVQNKPVAGNAGYQSSYGCVQSALRLKSGSSDVIVETQVWQAR